MSKRDRALVVLSGGQDSTTCLYLAKHELAREIHAITFDYGQRHQLEIAAAHTIAQMADVMTYELVRLGEGVLHGTSPLINPEQGVEGYANVAALPGGIEKTFVPMRNALFLTIAANRAAVLDCQLIVTGISQEDYGGYPDCRKEFVHVMQKMIDSALAESVRDIPELHAPLLFMSKMETVELATTLPGCLDALAFSHTCYRGEFPPCGDCHACLLRQKGFELAHHRDPLIARAYAMAETQ